MGGKVNTSPVSQRPLHEEAIKLQRETGDLLEDIKILYNEVIETRSHIANHTVNSDGRLKLRRALRNIRIGISTAEHTLNTLRYGIYQVIKVFDKNFPHPTKSSAARTEAKERAKFKQVAEEIKNE